MNDAMARMLARLSGASVEAASRWLDPPTLPEIDAADSPAPPKRPRSMVRTPAPKPKPSKVDPVQLSLLTVAREPMTATRER